MVDIPAPMTEVRAKSRGNGVWSQGSGVLGVDPFCIQKFMLWGTGHQRGKATLCRAAAWASGAPPVTAPMSQPAP